VPPLFFLSFFIFVDPSFSMYLPLLFLSFFSLSFFLYLFLPLVFWWFVRGDFLKISFHFSNFQFLVFYFKILPPLPFFIKFSFHTHFCCLHINYSFYLCIFVGTYNFYRFSSFYSLSHPHFLSKTLYRKNLLFSYHFIL